MTRIRVYLVAAVLSWFLAPFESVSASPRSNPPDPYKVLGVSKEAPQDEIRRQYRKLCLRLHPDKNVNQSPKERTKREDLFKRVQHANEQIGDEEARKRYDQISRFASPSGSPFGSTGSTGSGRPDAAEAFYRAYFGQDSTPRYPQQRAPRTPFYFNGVDISDLFSSGGRFSAGPAAFWGQGASLKSVYVQKVKVPLEDLYNGCDGKEFTVSDNLWKRYRAAFRGGVAVSLLYQGALFSLPLLRMSARASFLLGVMLFHVNLPRPMKLNYDVHIQRGWKGGTKLRFKEAEPGFDIVFVLEEEKHNRFVREGNDLKTSISVTAAEARDGCSVHIEPLSALDDLITVRLRPGEITRSGHRLSLKGKGWPHRKSGTQGDLIVTVNVLPNWWRAKQKKA